MQKLNQSQLAGIALKPKAYLGQVASTPFYEAISQLLVGEALMVTKEEWPNKMPPHKANMPNRLKPEGASYTTNILLDDTGWVVVRTA